MSLTQEQWIEKAKQVHGNKYDYSLVEYKRCDIKVKIICPKHGVFEQLPYGHLNGKKCYKCYLNSKCLTQEQWIQKANHVHRRYI
jgi:hypothetical protein